MRLRRSRLVLAGGVLACAAAPWPPLWLSDLLAAMAPWVSVAAGALALGLGVTRIRRWGLLPLALACSTAGLTLVAPRAPRAPRTSADSATVTVLVFNARTAPLAETLEFLRAHKADLAVLLEAPWDLFDSTAQDAGYRSRVALGPQSGGLGVRAVLSVWPIERLDERQEAPSTLAARVSSPLGPLVIVAPHFESPRTAHRWRQGNRGAREAAALASRLEAGGAATFIAGDFNSPPTGWRSRLLGRSGFRRARPLWPPRGSYPAWAPEGMSLALGGVAVGRGFSVVSWRTVEAPETGSDHRAVIVRLALEPRLQ